MTIVPDSVIKEAKSIFSKFVWNGPNKMKELAAIGDIQQGGMKMPHLESIIESLRAIWVKRYESNNYHPWKEFIIEGLKSTGSVSIINRKIPQNVVENTELSQFNKEIIKSWNQHQKIPKEPEDIANQILWNNEFITKPNNEIIYYENLAKQGINSVQDLITENKIIDVSTVNLRESTWRTKFELVSTLGCLPKAWKTGSFSERNTRNMDKYMKKITTRNIYKEKIEKIIIPPTSELFLSKLLNTPCDLIKEHYGIPFNTTIYTKLRSFQFKVIHNILYTNEKLHKIGYSDTALCTFCKKETETLLHLFVQCESISPLWKKITDNLLQPYGIETLSNKDILLGILVEKQNNVINHIIMEAKYYIYASKLEKSLPLYNRLINRLKLTESIEREIARKSEKKITVHTHKWHHLMEYLAA